MPTTSLKELELYAELLDLEEERFVTQPELKIQRSIEMFGEVEDTSSQTRRSLASVFRFEKKGKMKGQLPSFSQSTSDLYGDLSRIGVLYIKKGGVDEFSPKDFHLWVNVPIELIEFLAEKALSAKSLFLRLGLSVSPKFLVDNYVEPQVPELKNLISLDDIDDNHLVTCAVREIEVFTKQTNVNFVQS